MFISFVSLTCTQHLTGNVGSFIAGNISAMLCKLCSDKNVEISEFQGPGALYVQGMSDSQALQKKCEDTNYMTTM